MSILINIAILGAYFYSSWKDENANRIQRSLHVWVYFPRLSERV